jgi:hypothetical protein
MMRLGIGELAILAGIGYAIYAYAYKQQPAAQTQQDLLSIPTALASGISKAPEFFYETLSKSIPGYQEWSTEWVEEQLNKNGNRPN